MQQIRRSALSVIATFMALAYVARAEAPSDQWRFEVGSYFWATSLNGDTTASGNTIPVNADFLDVVDSVDSLTGLTLHTEAGRGRLSAFLDFNYVKLGVDNIPSDAGKLDISSTTLYVEAGAAYRLIDEAPLGPPDSATRFTLEALLGARLTTIETSASVPGPGNDVSQTNTWIDPIVGARTRFDFGPHWTAQLRGDVGGFGVGTQFSWNAVGILGYTFHLGTIPTTLYGGYRALGQDFKSSNFDWDTIVHGPVIGLNFTF